MLVKGVDYYKEYSNRVLDKMIDADLETLYPQKTTEVSIPLAMLNSAYEVFMDKNHSINLSPIPSDVKANIICKLEAEQIREIFNMTLEAVDRVLLFLSDNHLSAPSRIDYITYLVGCFVHLGDRDLEVNEEDFLIEWYESVEFSNLSNGIRRQIFDRLLVFDYAKY